MALYERGDGGDQLRQGGAQGYKGQRNDRFRHSQRLGDDGTVIHQEVGPHGDQRRADHQQQNILVKGLHFLFRLLFLFRTDGGNELWPLHRLGNGNGHVGDENQKHQHAGHSAEAAEEISRGHIYRGGSKEKGNGNAKGFSVDLTWAYRHHNGGDQRRIADDGADGVAVGDLSVPAYRRGGGNHHLRQGGADGDHRGADKDLRHMEPVGNARGPVHKPIPALNEQNETQQEQQNRNNHFLTTFLSFSGAAVKRSLSVLGFPKMRKTEHGFVPYPVLFLKTDPVYRPKLIHESRK